MTEVTAVSLGAGWGSVGMVLMMENGLFPDCPQPDLAVFADTQAEPPHVYETLDWLKPRLSYPLLVVSAGDLWADTWKLIQGAGATRLHPHGSDFVDIPVFGDSGLLSRQCTTEYKVRLIKRTVRQFAEATPPHLKVTQYLGISLDEATRMKDAPEGYITNRYPLIEYRVTRSAIMTYVKENFPSAPVGRSACFFCPFHSIAEWKEIRRRYPGLYQEAIEMERALKLMNRGPFYLYKGKYGLGLEEGMATADLQGILWPEADQFQNDCEGNCGV